MMRRKAFLALSLLLVFVLVGAKPAPFAARFFRGIKVESPAVERPASVPALFRFQPSVGRAVPIYYTYPLKKVNGHWAMAYKDMLRLVGKKSIHYLPDEKIVVINRMNRLYMAVDKKAAIRQSGRVTVESYPTFEGDVLYVPLIFCLENMGYTVNVSGDEMRLMIIPPREEAKVVAQRSIKVGSIHPYRDGSMDTRVYDMNGVDLWGWGEKVPGGMGSFFQLNGKQAVNFLGDLALEAPADYDELTQSALASDGYRLYVYSMDQSRRQSYPIPYAMEKAKKLCYDDGHIYFQKAEGVFVFYPETKVLKRVIGRSVADFDVQKGRIVYQADGSLYLKKEASLAQRIDEAMPFELSASYIVLDDGELGLVRVVSTDDLHVVTSLAYDTARRHSIKLMNDRYLAVAQGTTVVLKDLDSDVAHTLDTVNIDDTLRGRNVLWLWNGNALKGYVYGDGVKIAQSVTVNL